MVGSVDTMETDLAAFVVAAAGAFAREGGWTVATAVRVLGPADCWTERYGLFEVSLRPGDPRLLFVTLQYVEGRGADAPVGLTEAFLREPVALADLQRVLGTGSGQVQPPQHGHVDADGRMHTDAPYGEQVFDPIDGVTVRATFHVRPTGPMVDRVIWEPARR